MSNAGLSWKNQKATVSAKHRQQLLLWLRGSLSLEVVGTPLVCYF